jgi:hypothetical protein
MTSLEPNAEVLAIYPPQIDGATHGVISDPAAPAGVPVQGVPLSLFQAVPNANGVLSFAVKLRVDPPPVEGADDINAITYWLNGKPIETRAITADNRNQPVFFNVFQSELLDNAINKIFYMLERPSGNTSPSVELWLLYSETLPGGNDVQGTGVHPNLAISLPAELGDPPSIGKDEADNGVIVTLGYPFMKAYDVITLEINRERFNYTVKPAEAGRPFAAVVNREMFELVGSLDACPFSYTVVDQLRNATHKRRWSKIIRADIDIDRVTLDKPILREDPADNNDDASIVDLDKLNGRPLLVVIVPSAPTYREGDEVMAVYRATGPDSNVRLTGKIVANFGVLQPCILQVPNAQVVSGSQVQVTFELSRAGQVIGGSKAALAKVIGGVVVPDEKPVIQAVIGKSSGAAIPPGSTTEETAVTLSGTASKGLQVELFDHLDSKGTVTADATSSVWTFAVSGLNVAAHSFTAKAQYGANPASDAWGFTVKAAQTDQRPEISKIEDSNGEILDNDVTEDTVVLLTGKALPNGEIEIYDWIDSKGKVSASGSGIWTYRLENLVKGDRIIKAKALYGGGLDSNVRFFTVKESGPELEFDERPASISGFRQIFFAGKGFEPKEPFAASYLDRPASGGTPPYSYSCSDDNVAFVNGEGRIYAYKNGVAEITVVDNIGKSKKFKLTTSGSFNEWRYLGNFDQNSAQKAAISAGGIMPSIGDLEKMHKAYKSAPQGNSLIWSSTSPDGGWRYHVLDFSTGKVTNLLSSDEGIGAFVIISS